MNHSPVRIALSAKGDPFPGLEAEIVFEGKDVLKKANAFLVNLAQGIHNPVFRVVRAIVEFDDGHRWLTFIHATSRRTPNLGADMNAAARYWGRSLAKEEMSRGMYWKYLALVDSMMPTQQLMARRFQHYRLDESPG